jgi:rhodanese-related sulfurtransferase/DNA-binding transcriptional ArsR family regulator
LLNDSRWFCYSLNFFSTLLSSTAVFPQTKNKNSFAKALTGAKHSSNLLNIRVTTTFRKDSVKHMNTQDKRAFKNHLYEQFARIGKALSSSHRLELLEVLAQGEHSVEELAKETGMSVANASQHLQVLRAAQLVEVRREGVYIFYRLADEQVFTLWQALRNVGEARIAEIDRIVSTYLHDRDHLQPIDATELLKRLAEGQVILLDVRPVEEYATAHIPGALSIPVAELETRLPELPQDREVVAYCRGPYCVFADEAVTLLRTNGYQASRLEQGLPDWRRLGLPVESGKGEH